MVSRWGFRRRWPWPISGYSCGIHLEINGEKPWDSQ